MKDELKLGKLIRKKTKKKKKKMKTKKKKEKKKKRKRKEKKAKNCSDWRVCGDCLRKLITTPKTTKKNKQQKKDDERTCTLAALEAVRPNVLRQSTFFEDCSA